MVWLGFALIQPRAGIGRLAGAGLAICWLDEASQLYHAPAIDALRATTAAHLALGSAFSWYDMLAYAAGIGLAGAADLGRRRWRQ
jgi:hypothetical protein